MQKETQTQNYILRREYRKSLKLSITPQVEVLVQAPWNLSQAAISQFLEKHAAWIAAHLAEAEQNRASRQEWLESILFLGREYPVRRWAQREVCLSKANLYLPELDSPEKERRKVAAWYRAQAQVLLPRRTQFWAGKMQKNYRQVRISSARKRWGSCTGEGVISFSWRLLQAPPAAVDYVIIHELAHRYRIEPLPGVLGLCRGLLPGLSGQKAPVGADGRGDAPHRVGCLSCKWVKKREQHRCSHGAEGRTRTGTVSLPVDFESTTSANSITSANRTYHSRKTRARQGLKREKWMKFNA